MKKMKYIKEHIITAAARTATAAHTAAAALRTTAAARTAALLTALLISAGSLTAQQPAEQHQTAEQHQPAEQQPPHQQEQPAQPQSALQQPAQHPAEQPASVELPPLEGKPATKRLSGHLIGVKYGFANCNLSFDKKINQKGITSGKEIGIFYTYYHSLWNTMPYFGLSVGVQMAESGFKLVNDGYFPPEDQPQDNLPEEEYRYRIIQIPVISQFRVEFWRMRAMLNLGCYGSYKISAVKEGQYSQNVNKPEVGVIGGGGLAFIFHPFELHLEANYHYAFSLYFKPDTFSERVWYLGHNSRLVFNLGLFFSLDKKKK